MFQRIATFLALCLISAHSFSQVKVPAQTLTLIFPDRRASFILQNTGQNPVIVQVDLANRGNVHQGSNDGLAILYPRVSRIEPGATQRISVTWRGNTDRSYYYLARINTLEETELQKDRSETHAEKGLKVKVGQAFPVHLEAPHTRPIIRVANKNDEVAIINTGLRGDHIETLRLSNGQLLPFKRFIIPGQSIPVVETVGSQKITAVKLRRFGWVTISDQP